MHPPDDTTQDPLGGPDDPAQGSEQSVQGRHGHALEKTGPSEPLPLEDDDDPGHGTAPAPAPAPGDSVKALDVCPNCGSTMPDATTLVCLRCGYNLKTLKVEKTETPKADVEEDTEPQEANEPLATPGQGGVRAALGLAGLSGALLLVGYLSGAGALLPGIEDPSFLDGLGALVGEVIRVAALAGCGLGALALLARFSLETSMGDLRLAAARVLGIVATARLVAYLPINIRSLAVTFETLAMAGVCLGMLMYFFVLNAHDAAIAVFTSFVLFVILLGISAAVYWGVVQ